MGIGSNYIVENAEEEHLESLKDEVFREAAINVANGESREGAIESAKELIAAQQEALSAQEYSEDPETNIITFTDSNNEGSAIPKGKERQVAAINNDLQDKFDIDL